MVISAYAKFLAPCFGTVQAEPIALGAGQNGSEILTYSGRALTSVSPTQLKQLLTGSKTDPLVKLRTIRDTTIGANLSGTTLARERLRRPSSTRWRSARSRCDTLFSPRRP